MIVEGRLEPGSPPTQEYDEGVMEALGLGLSPGINVRQIKEPTKAASYLKTASERAHEKIEYEIRRKWLCYEDPIELSRLSDTKQIDDDFADAKQVDDQRAEVQMLVELEPVTKNEAELRALHRIATSSGDPISAPRAAFEAEGLSRIDFKNLQERAKRRRRHKA